MITRNCTENTPSKRNSDKLFESDGADFNDIGTPPLSDQDIRYTGKLFESDTGKHYFNARYLNAITDTTNPELPPRFLTPDIIIGTPENPQSWNRYVSMANNPVNYIDPDGKKVRPSSLNAFDLIVRSLPVETRRYVQIGPDGFIDPNLINKCKNRDINFHSLRQLVNSPAVVEVHWRSKADVSDWNRTFTETYQMTPMDMGITLVGRASTNEASLYSPDSSIHVYINPRFVGIDATETLAHELYGHAWTYIMGLTPWNHIVEWDYQTTKTGIRAERRFRDTELERRMRKVEKAARKNHTE